LLFHFLSRRLCPLPPVPGAEMRAWRQREG
jgi:hypothetical protein